VHWKLALVEKLIKGNDGQIRAAHICTSSGKTNRPIAKLYPLETTAQEQSTEPNQENTSSKSQDNNQELPFNLQERQHRKNAKELLSRLINFVPGECQGNQR